VFAVAVPLPLFDGFLVSFETRGTPEPVIEAPAEFVPVELIGLVTLLEVGMSVGALTDFSLRSDVIGKKDHIKLTNVCRRTQDFFAVRWESFLNEASISIRWIKQTPRGRLWAALECFNSCVLQLTLLACVVVAHEGAEAWSTEQINFYQQAPKQQPKSTSYPFLQHPLPPVAHIVPCFPISL